MSIERNSQEDRISAISNNETSVDAIVLRTSVIPDNGKALGDNIYRVMLPKLIRLLRGAGYRHRTVDDIDVLEVFEDWFQKMYENAEKNHYDVKNGVPCSDELLDRFATMWGTTFACEHDWPTIVRTLIGERLAHIAGGSSHYPQTLIDLEASLIARNIKMYPTDAAGVLLAWAIKSIDSDGDFYLPERHAGKWTAEIAGREIRDLEEARSIGRTMIRKLIRLGIIKLITPGIARTKDRTATRAAAYRWVWGAVVEGQG